MQSTAAAYQSERASDLPAFGAGFTPVIPTLGEHFLSKIELGDPMQIALWGSFALDVLDNNVDLPLSGTEGPGEVLQSVLQAWADDNKLDGDGRLQLRLTTTTDPTFLECIEQRYDEGQFASVREAPFFLELNASYAGLKFIGEKMGQVYQQHPDLATWLMSVMNYAADKGFWMVTPSELRGLASSTYWMGEDDESLVMEEYAECCDSEEELEAYRANIVTSDNFKAHFPEWALKLSTEGGLFDAVQWKEENPLCDEKDSAWIHRAVDLAIAMKAFLDTNESLPGSIAQNCYGSAVCPHTVIGWLPESEDLVVRVFDDYANDAYECSAIEEAAIVPLFKPQDLQVTLDGFGRTFTFHNHFDELINLLSP